MKPDQFARVKEILLQVADLSEDERQAFLERACKDDPDLRREVETILAHADDATGIMKTAGAAPPSPADRAPQPETIGSYRILEPIGEGGMGIVYLAEQTEPIRRRVALKVIKPGMDSGEVLARFEAERQALALMDHPTIAQIYDAGATEQSLPYFVMEHVPGISITEYADQRRLTTEDRLRLFQKVCEGVQHAHQKAVIHRDLKPSNILVVDVDGEATPKIIDFGVAKATTQKLTERTMFTSAGQLVGTPEYMSPEQADFTGDVDTRTDVYSLGVVLYVLLTGAPPFEPQRFRDSGLEGIIRLLREEEPPRPSTKVSTLGETTPEITHRRRTDRKQLTSQLKGDLDWIVMRCLEKDRNRRYGSPQELADDIKRHLGHEPVLARPPSRIYRFRKLVRRHKAPFAFAGVVFALLIAFGITMTGMYGAQRAERARAQLEAEKARQVSDFLEFMLAPSRHREVGWGREDLTVREVLDRAAENVDEQLADQPEIQAAIQTIIGNAYAELSLWEPAEAHLHAVVETRRRVLGDRHPQTATALNELAWAVHKRGDMEGAEQFAREAVSIHRRLGEEHVSAARSLAVLGDILRHQEDIDGAAVCLEEALAMQQELLGSEHKQTTSTLNDLGLVYYFGMHDRDRAEPLFREALAINRQLFGEVHPSVSRNMLNLADLLRGEGEYDSALSLYRRRLEIERELDPAGEGVAQSLGRIGVELERKGDRDEAERLLTESLSLYRKLPVRPTRLAQGVSALGALKYGRREYAAALPLYREALALYQEGEGRDHRQTVTALRNVALALRYLGQFEEAATLSRKSLSVSRRVFGEKHLETARSQTSLGAILVLQKKFAEAEMLFRESLAITRGSSTGTETDVANIRFHLGRCLSAVGRYEEAELVLLKSYEYFVTTPGKGRVCLGRVIELYDAWGKPAKAAAFRSKLASLDSPGSTR